MRALPRFLCACILAPAVGTARAETWRTTNGDQVDGKLSGVYGSVAVISRKTDSAILSLDRIDDEGLARIADYLASSPQSAPAWAASSGKVAKSLRGRLQIMRDGRLVDFDPGARPEPELYLVYFGAHWCRPCREFSPYLLETYRRLKQMSPGHFEVVFVSGDHKADEQELYVRELGMPWPLVRFSDVGNVGAIERWEGPGIPDLVVLTRNGDVVFDSYRGSDYVGPGSVLEQVEPLLAAMNRDSQACRRALHRLSVVEHIRAAGNGSVNPKPYLVTLDPARYQTLEVKQLKALLEIDERGHVTDAKIEPRLPTALDFQLTQEAETWLFLPAVAAGRAKATRVLLPINLLAGASKS
jgi:thiol-disulfide isomerase/thioredoxin